MRVAFPPINARHNYLFTRRVFAAKESLARFSTEARRGQISSRFSPSRQESSVRRFIPNAGSSVISTESPANATDRDSDRNTTIAIPYINRAVARTIFPAFAGISSRIHTRTLAHDLFFFQPGLSAPTASACIARRVIGCSCNAAKL